MNKATVNNAHWQARAGSFSTHASRTGVNLLGWDAGTTEHMTPEQERDALKARLLQIRAVFESGEPIGKALRKRLGREQFDLQEQMRRIRPKLRTPGIEHYVLDILRERLDKREWNALFEEAKRRHAEEINAQTGGKCNG